jgi:predicted permease
VNWLGRLFHRSKQDAQLDSELRFHVEQQTADNIAAGMNPDEARRRALAQFGGLEYIKEETRDARGTQFLESLLQDIRFALRMLRKSPGFTTVAVLTLALGIGANTAMFSIIENVILQPLHFSAPNELVHIDSTKDGHPVGPSPFDMLDFEQSNHTFQSLAVYDIWRKNVSFTDTATEPEQMLVGLVPGAYFQVLDIKPVMGRLFTDAQNDPRKHYVAVISTTLWETRYADDPAILGRTIRINDEPYAIVAVIPDAIPAWMQGAIQVWTPFVFADSLGDLWTEAGRAGRGWYSLGRLKAGVSLQEAEADLASIAARLAETHPLDRGFGVKLEALSQTRIGDLRPTLFLLMGAVSLILLIACVNLANLLLARNSVRQRELAVRAALGAKRERLVRQLAVETSLLALLSGAVGFALAKIGVVLVTRIHPQDVPQLASVDLDWRVLAFALIVSLATSLLLGLVPAMAASRLDLVENLKSSSRSGAAGSAAQRMRNVLVVTEIAMSLVLIVGAGLLLQSIARLQHQTLGIQAPGHLLKGHFYLPPARYANPGIITRFSDQFAARVRDLPGVTDASITTIWPPTYDWPQMFEIPGQPVARIQDIPRAQFALSDAHFLRTMGIPLIRGRDFSESDSDTTLPVALINQELAHRYFPNEDPIGLRIHIGPPQFMNIPPGAGTNDSSDVTIVGIVGDFRNAGLASPPQPQIIVLYSQQPLVNYGFKDIVIHTASDPRAMIPAIAQQLHAMDQSLPLSEVQTISEVTEQNTGSLRFTTMLLGLFAAIGLALAAVGNYGVVSYVVAQRSQEFGIRTALGAQRHDVLRLVLSYGLRLALLGTAIGIVGTLALTRFLSSLLYGVRTTDPSTLVLGCLIMTSVALAACYIPARRAMKVDAIAVLRHE